MRRSRLHVDYRERLVAVTDELDLARREERFGDEQALELAATVLRQLLAEMELEQGRLAPVEEARLYALA